MSNEHHTSENGSVNPPPINSVAPQETNPAPVQSEAPAAQPQQTAMPQAAPVQPAAPEASPQPAPSIEAKKTPEMSINGVPMNNTVAAPGLGEVKYAGFWVRFVAMIIDVALIFGLCWLIQSLTGVELIENTVRNGQASADLNPLGGLIYIIYFIITTGSKLQGTIGKRILGLRVIKPDGSKITFLGATGRFFSYILSNLTFLIGYIMIGFSKEKKALHDIVANTRVVYAESLK